MSKKLRCYPDLADKSKMIPRAEKSLEQLDERAALQYSIKRQLDAYDTSDIEVQSGIVRIPLMTGELLEFAKKTCVNIGPWMLQVGMFDAITGVGVLKYKYPRSGASTNKILVIADQGAYSIWGEREVESVKPLAYEIDFDRSNELFEDYIKRLQSPVSSNSLQPIAAESSVFPAQKLDSPFEPPLPLYDSYEEIEVFEEVAVIPEEDSPSEIAVLSNLGLWEHLLPKKE